MVNYLRINVISCSAAYLLQIVNASFTSEWCAFLCDLYRSVRYFLSFLCSLLSWYLLLGVDRCKRYTVNVAKKDFILHVTAFHYKYSVQCGQC